MPRRTRNSGLSHLDARSRPTMVDVGAKAVTHRIAEAEARIRLPVAVARALKRSGQRTKKGPVFDTAIVAGVMAAKRTSELIPLCHPLALSSVDVQLSLDPKRRAVDIEATCKLKGRTGVEMEALTAASVAALTVYDMCKSVDRGMVISDVRLLHKSGGKSGTWNG
jgi:cyclic pyranopterin monophosphate synthase